MPSTGALRMCIPAFHPEHHHCCTHICACRGSHVQRVTRFGPCLHTPLHVHACAGELGPLAPCWRSCGCCLLEQQGRKTVRWVGGFGGWGRRWGVASSCPSFASCSCTSLCTTPRPCKAMMSSNILAGSLQSAAVTYAWQWWHCVSGRVGEPCGLQLLRRGCHGQCASWHGHQMGPTLCCVTASARGAQRQQPAAQHAQRGACMPSASLSKRNMLHAPHAVAVGHPCTHSQIAWATRPLHTELRAPPLLCPLLITIHAWRLRQLRCSAQCTKHSALHTAQYETQRSRNNGQCLALVHCCR